MRASVMKISSNGFILTTIKGWIARYGVRWRTVEFYKYTIMQQLEIKNGAELVHFAIKHGIISI
jgi:hypothetical protein